MARLMKKALVFLVPAALALAVAAPWLDLR